VTSKPTSSDEIRKKKHGSTFLRALSLPTFEEYVNVDEELPTSGDMTEDEIVDYCTTSGCMEQGAEEKEEQDNENNSNDRQVTLREAYAALETLTMFFERSEVSNNVFEKVLELDRALKESTSRRKKQAKITDYIN
jgi:hypothetical protein